MNKKSMLETLVSNYSSLYKTRAQLDIRSNNERYR